MQNFNVEEFMKNAIGGVYNRTLEDGTLIKQFGNPNSGWVENETPLKGWYYTQSEFYGNGIPKSTGHRFKKGDFKSGQWLLFDSTGKQVEEINEDKPFKLNVEDIFEKLKQEKIPFSMENMYNAITRGTKSPGSPYIWIVEYKTLPDRIERVEIDDITGKIVDRDFTPFNEHH